MDLTRKPTHAGEILKNEFLEPLGITQSQLAKELHTTFRTVNEKRNISPEMAIRLSKYFGTSAELWLNLQNQYYLYAIKAKRRNVLEAIRPFKKEIVKV